MNQAIFTYLNSFALRSEALDTLVIFGAVFLGWVLVVGLSLFLIHPPEGDETTREKKLFGFLWERRIRELGVVLLGTIFAWAIAEIIKYFYMSPRPFLVLSDVNLLFLHGDNDSFPSGHATFFFALATALYFYHRQMALLYFVGALAIGLSRVVAGVHWPVDIVWGYVLGGVIAYMAYCIYRRYK